MNRILTLMAFHSNGKPRGWVRRLVFEQGRSPRQVFRRAVFKKNGTVRAHFEYWMSGMLIAGSRDTILGRPDAWADSLAHLGSAGQTLCALQPLEQTTTRWINHERPVSVLTAEEVKQRLETSLAAGKDWLLISVGHDDYTKINGGIQMCIQREEQLTLAKRGLYLNIHPWQPLPRLAHLSDTPDPLVNLTLDGKSLGTCPMSEVEVVVSGLAARSVRIEVAVHQLLGHNPEQIASLVKATKSGRCVFWLHDFFSLCPSFTLQRNNLEFCGAPPSTSNACGLCIYGDERRDHLTRFATFFRDVDVHLMSPSQVTLDFWTKRTDLPTASMKVEPHMTLKWIPRATSAGINSSRPVTVAFLGTPAAHKGWPMFERLSKSEDLWTGFRFLIFSSTQPAGSTVKRIGVSVTASNPTAMSDAVNAAGVDIVVHWPSWPETFSLTTYEAMAGGAYLVTNRISGNVAATVNDLHRGAVLADETELLTFFRDGRAARMAQESRKSRAGSSVLQSLSAMSVSLLAEVR